MEGLFRVEATEIHDAKNQDIYWAKVLWFRLTYMAFEDLRYFVSKVEKGKRPSTECYIRAEQSTFFFSHAVKDKKDGSIHGSYFRFLMDEIGYEDDPIVRKIEAEVKRLMVIYNSYPNKLVAAGKDRFLQRSKSPRP